MPLIQPDTSAAVDLSTPIAPGTYPAKITEAKTQLSKEKKNLMVVPKFAIAVDDKTPRTRTSYLVIAGEGSYGFDQLLRACHFDDLADAYKDPSVTPKPDFDTDTLIGQELMVVVDAEYQQPKDQQGNPVGEPQIRDRIKTFLKA